MLPPPILILCQVATNRARTPKISTIAATNNTVGIFADTSSTPAVKLPTKLSAEVFSALPSVNNPAPFNVDTITKAIITPIIKEATPTQVQ